MKKTQDITTIHNVSNDIACTTSSMRNTKPHHGKFPYFIFNLHNTEKEKVRKVKRYGQEDSEAYQFSMTYVNMQSRTRNLKVGRKDS